MKTVCPHCHQKYEVPDDYLQQEVSCEKCQKNFTATKAKFCAECGAANSAQALQCHACQHPFQSQTCTEEKETKPQRPVPLNPDDRSPAKLSLPMKTIALFFGVICVFCVFGGIDMIVSCFLKKDEELTIKVVHCVIGCLSIAVYGRLAMLVNTLTRPDKKAVQTLWVRMALLGGAALSIVGLIFSLLTVTGTSQILSALLNILMLLFIYKIFQLWNERCILDEHYEEPEKSEKAGNSTFVCVSIVFGILGFIPMAGLFLSAAAIFFGINAYGKGRKAGLVGMSLGAVALIGNIVYVVMKSRGLL
jgi:hypothetical protein